MRTGIGVADAMKALRTLDVDAEALASIERSVNAYEESRMACRPNSFPGTTHVLMADGTTKEIKDVRTGDAVLATDPGNVRTEGRAVTDTVYSPDDTDFADITIDAGRSRITATQHHPFWSPSAHRWIDAGDLKPGQTLRTSSRDTVAVIRVHRYQRLHSAYNLGVADIHTYYVLAGATPVLVHNTFCPIGFADLGGGKLEWRADLRSRQKVRQQDRPCARPHGARCLQSDPHGVRREGPRQGARPGGRGVGHAEQGDKGSRGRLQVRLPHGKNDRNQGREVSADRGQSADQGDSERLSGGFAVAARAAS